MNKRAPWALLITLTVMLFAGATTAVRATILGAPVESAAAGARVHHPLVGVSFSSGPVSWLDYLNQFRAMAHLAPVTENADWSHGSWLHARYMVKNDIVLHSEDPSNPWYTPQGASAAQASGLVGAGQVDLTDQWAIDAWMQAPFHAVSILSPRLRSVGYGSYREADGGLQMAAALDVIQGLGSVPPGTIFPVLWPGPGSVTPLRTHWGEAPDPLTNCPGYVEPAGLPIIVEIGTGSEIPNVTAHTFVHDGQPLDHCVFDETNYTNPNPVLQSTGRNILNAYDAIFLIPKQPLLPNATYTVALTVNGRDYNWSFAVAGSP